MDWDYVTKHNFFDSIQTGVWKAFIDCVLGAGFDISTKKSNGYTVLSFAAEYGDCEIVEYLVQKGADGNVTNCDGTKPLHIAAKHSHRDVVKYFVNLGVFVDSRDTNNRTPLHCASETFHEQNIDSGGWHIEDSIHRSDDDTMESTCTATEMHMELVHFLLLNSADVNACDGSGDVPILIAAKYSCVDVIRMLIVFNANVRCCDREKWTVLHYASLNGWLNVVQSLLDKRCNVNAKTSRGDTSILFALQNSHRDIYDLLVKARANIKFRDRGRMTVLHYACRNGWKDVVQSLVESGFYIDAESYSGESPLLLAARNGHKDIVEMLLKKGACFESCNKKRWTLLHYSCRSGWLDIVKFLMKSRCDLNARTRDGETLLFIAAKFSRLDILYHLIEGGADVNATVLVPFFIEPMYEDSDGCDMVETWALLKYASSKGWVEVVQGLIKKRVDINKKDRMGNTALIAAFGGGYLEIVKHLLNAGADCNIGYEYSKSLPGYLTRINLANAVTIRLLIEHGLCLQYSDYNTLNRAEFFKKDILRDAELCTQAIVNKFNNIDLVAVYKKPVAVEYLPPIERMKMRSNGNRVRSIEQSVRHKIETNGFCNLLEVRPIVLSLLAVRSFIRNRDVVNI